MSCIHNILKFTHKKTKTEVKSNAQLQTIGHS